MKRFFLVLILSVLCLDAGAQRINPDAYGNEVSMGIGLGAAFRGNYGADANFWMNYSMYYNRHLGMRVGMQYMPEFLDKTDFFRFPMALSLRTGTRMVDGGWVYGGLLALDLLDTFVWDDENFFADMFAILMLSLINRVEFFGGMTPGIVSGDKPLFCSADAGVNLSWRLWRFTVNLTPSFHYNLTDNFRYYDEDYYRGGQSVKWLFNLNFGLGFMF